MIRHRLISKDPFDVSIRDGTSLHSLIDCYDPACHGAEEDDHYGWISDHLVCIVEKAIKKRENWP